jgi:PAS domain S-box-containing protein
MPQLKLSQKGVLLVAIPLCLLCVFYFGLKLRLNAVRQQMSEEEHRMSIVSSINNLQVKSFFAFQSLLQLKMHGKLEERMALNEFMQMLTRDATALVASLRSDDHDEANAIRLERAFNVFMTAFKKSNFNPNAEDEVGSILRNIDENQKFLNTASVFFTALSEVAKVEQGAEFDSHARLQLSRKALETWVDVVVMSTFAITLVTSVQFFRGTVRNLMKVKENAWRFQQGKELLKPIGTSDEIGEVDRVFHDMAYTITRAQERDNQNIRLLQESKERLDTLLNNLPIAVLVTNPEGSIETLNPAAISLFEYSLSELKNKPLDTIFPSGGSSKTILKNLKEASMMPLEAISKNQEAIYTEVQKKNFHSSDGERVLVAALDVSERHNLERMTKDFYAMVSHDIRSPLNAIDNSLQIALSHKYGALNQDMEERLAGARRNIAQLMALVNKLLELEKLESVSEMSMEPVALDEVLSDAYELYSRQMEAKQVACEKVCDKVKVRGDRQYILQVFSNLLANATKYSPDQSQLLLRTHAVDDYGEFFVRDEGPGVPREMRSEIFERFRQMPQTGSGQQGFGLGLAICKQIVERHGGAIGVRNRGDGAQGSEFWVRFKRYDEQA